MRGAVLRRGRRKVGRKGGRKSGRRTPWGVRAFAAAPANRPPIETTNIRRGERTERQGKQKTAGDGDR